jgi:hypothetical protein
MGNNGCLNLAKAEHNLILSKALPASNPPLISKATIFPLNFICFLQFHIEDAISKRIFHFIHLRMIL